MSFKDDINELLSPSNFITLLLAYIIMLSTSKNKLLVLIWEISLLIIGLSFYFLIRWLFVYRKEKSAWAFV